MVLITLLRNLHYYHASIRLRSEGIGAIWGQKHTSRRFRSGRRNIMLLLDYQLSDRKISDLNEVSR